eukprot:5162340-Karenia_brevis.AAC.2
MSVAIEGEGMSMASRTKQFLLQAAGAARGKAWRWVSQALGFGVAMTLRGVIWESSSTSTGLAAISPGSSSVVAVKVLRRLLLERASLSLSIKMKTHAHPGQDLNESSHAQVEEK